jgi:hypothetical protein
VFGKNHTSCHKQIKTKPHDFVCEQFKWYIWQTAHTRTFLENCSGVYIMCREGEQKVHHYVENNEHFEQRHVRIEQD